MNLPLEITKHSRYDPAFSTKQGAVYLGICEDELKRKARRGEIRSSRSSGVRSHLKFRLSFLNEWLAKNEQPQGKKN